MKKLSFIRAYSVFIKVLYNVVLLFSASLQCFIFQRLYPLRIEFQLIFDVNCMDFKTSILNESLCTSIRVPFNSNYYITNDRQDKYKEQFRCSQNTVYFV